MLDRSTEKNEILITLSVFINVIKKKKTLYVKGVI